MELKKRNIGYAFTLLVAINLYLICEETNYKYQKMMASDITSDHVAFFANSWGHVNTSIWLLFVIYPFYLLLKLLFITCILDTGFALSKKEIPFKTLFITVLFGEFVYIIPAIYKLIWQPDWWENPYLPFVNFSAISFLNSKNPTFFIKYLANAYSLIEFLYVFVIILLISYLSTIKWKESSVLVMKTYGFAYFLWSLGIGIYLSNINPT